ncbi:MAG: glycosyltransferase family 2 protein [Marinicella sp.]
MTQAEQFDVVIVNYNSGLALEKCIQAINQTPEFKAHVVVVDNHSTDQSLTAIEQTDGPVHIIKNKENFGFAKACNQGAKQGHAKHIVILNPDCFVSSEQLHKLSSLLSQHKEAALIGCRVLNENGCLQAASRRRLPTFWRIVLHKTKLSQLPFFAGINIKDDGVFDEIIAVEAVNGACYVVNRDDFDQLSGFDESYPLHFEDLDLFARLKKNNRQIIYDSSVEVIHLQGHSIQQKSTINAWKKQGLLRYLSKHRPQWEYLMAKLFLGAK